MVKKGLFKNITKQFSLTALQKKVNFFLKGGNANRILFLVATLLVLYMFYVKFLNTEGFESKASDFDTELVRNKNDKVLVMFYADWCGHCKKLKPVWDETAKIVNSDQNNRCKMIKVNCGKPNEDESQMKIMKKYDIQGYPTIKYFENGDAKEYEGERSKDGILSFLGLA